jgi:lysyl-tRNA synthetase class 2
MGKGKIIDEIFGEKCEGHYIQPTFSGWAVFLCVFCSKDNINYRKRPLRFSQRPLLLML